MKHILTFLTILLLIFMCNISYAQTITTNATADKPDGNSLPCSYYGNCPRCDKYLIGTDAYRTCVNYWLKSTIKDENTEVNTNQKETEKETINSRNTMSNLYKNLVDFLHSFFNF